MTQQAHTQRRTDVTAPLTTRYIEATVKSLPAHLQQDVRDELSGSIADAIESHIEQGALPADAEKAVLLELGDPSALAAGYADRPLHLIGPKYYLTWQRLLKILIVVIPLCAAGGTAIAKGLAGSSTIDVLLGAAGIALTTAVHVAFWVTVVFVILERTGTDLDLAWDPEQLPDPEAPSGGRVELGFELGFLALGAGALLWDRFIGLFRPGNETVSILNPGLWPWVISALLVILAVQAALAIAVHVKGRWTLSLAVINTVIALAFAAIVLTLISRGELINPEFVDRALTPNNVNIDADGSSVLTTLLTLGIAAATAWEIFDSWRKALGHNSPNRR